MEWFKTKQSFTNIFTGERNVKSLPQIYDDDVEAERERIATSTGSEDIIRVDKLRKVYMLGGGVNKVAVDSVSFGTKNGECFALLGVNGAGKTTTFKMLSGEIPPTMGKVLIFYELLGNFDNRQ